MIGFEDNVCESEAPMGDCPSFAGNGYAHQAPPTAIETPVSAIDATLAERGARYGSFIDQGRVEQNLKRAMHDSSNWASLPDDSKSALEMIATKISRILKGDPEYDDSWRDIAGYSTLIVNRLAG